MSQDTAQVNPSSRLATIESLAGRGTFVIDHSSFSSTCDKVLINGHYYSSKPPMLPVISTGAYIVFSEVTGISFDSNRSASVRFLSLFAGGLPYLILLVFFYLLLRKMFKSDRTVILGTLVFTLNFIGLGYATSLNNHTPAAACILVSFYFAYLLRTGLRSDRRLWILSGFLAGLGATFEFWGGLFCLAFLLYLASTDRKRLLCLFLPSLLVPIIIHFLLTRAATGSLLPVYMRPELYRFDGGYWTAPTGIDNLSESKFVYFFNILLGHHGLFSMTPVFILSFWSMAAVLRKKGRLWREALVTGVPAALAIILLGIRTRNYGGVCAGLRWMIFCMPMLFIFTAQWIDSHRDRKWMILLLILAAAGLVMAADVPWASAGPWHHSAWHRYVFGLY